MKIIFLSQYFYPHLGGVEKHVLELGKILVKKGHSVTVITDKYTDELKLKEKYERINVVRFSYSKTKYLGLLYIWYWVIKNRELLLKADIVHCHDIFIWYLPLRLIYPFKKVYLTIHGWEGFFPIPFKNQLLKKVSIYLSCGNIIVGKYIEKWYGVKADKVIYGAVNMPNYPRKKIKDTYLFLGRLSEDTGLNKFLDFLRDKNYRAIFCGEGPLRSICEKHGKVLGLVEPKPYLEVSEFCFASGYLSCLEAFAYKCKVIVDWENKLKKDYWQLTPFYKFIKNQDIEGSYDWVKNETWEKLTQEYLFLWKSK